jgi:hypothetical protein
LPKNGSDHWPLLLSTNGPSLNNPAIFRFDPAWLDIAEFQNLMNKWREKIKLEGDIGKSWHCKLKKLRNKIKGWFKNYKAAKSKVWKVALSILHKLQKVMEVRDLTCEESQLWKTNKSILEDYYLEEEKYWKLRSKEQWFKSDDLNTTYFHRLATHRKKRNLILRKEIEGNISDSLPHIQSHIFEFYRALFGQVGGQTC